jgi:hypothetical protein
MSSESAGKRASGGGLSTVAVTTLVLYVVAALAWIYAVLDNGNLAHRIGFWPVVVGTIVFYAAVGAGVGSWWALVLPVVTFLLSLPAGDNRDLSGDTTWVPLYGIFFAPWAFAGVAGGVLAAKLAGRRRATGS